MNITDLLLGKESSDAIGALARQFGVTEAQARDAVSSMAPSLSRGMQHHTKELRFNFQVQQCLNG